MTLVPQLLVQAAHDLFLWLERQLPAPSVLYLQTGTLGAFGGVTTALGMHLRRLELVTSDGEHVADVSTHCFKLKLSSWFFRHVDAIRHGGAAYDR